MLPCAKHPSEESFALSVLNDSMTCSGLKSFPVDTVIVVDPSEEVSNNDFVIARTSNDDSLIFKQYVVDGESKYLRSLNPQYPLITDPFTVVGKVIQAIISL